MLTVKVYGGAAPPYHSAHYAILEGTGGASDAGEELQCEFKVHAEPGPGLLRWQILKAPRGRGNWIRPEGFKDPPGDKPVEQGAFWARRIDPMNQAECPAGVLWVRYRSASVGFTRRSPDPATNIGTSCYVDSAWTVLHALVPADIPEGSRTAAAAAAAVEAAGSAQTKKRAVCAHLAFRGCCGSCEINNKSCVALEPGERVGCTHYQFERACKDCRVGDTKKGVATCRIVPPEHPVDASPRLVCGHRRFQEHCGDEDCGENGTECLTLEAGEFVGCVHRDFRECCDACNFIDEEKVMALGRPGCPGIGFATRAGPLRRLLPGPEHLQQLADHFCPRLWLHPNEQHLPSSVEDFMAAAELRYKGEVRVPRGQLNSRTLAEAATGGMSVEGLVRRDNDWEMKCSDDFQRGTGWDADGKPCAEKLRRIPVYCRTRGARIQGEEVVALTYCTFYPCNGAYSVAGTYLMGGHEGDWEHATVHVHRRPAAAAAARGGYSDARGSPKSPRSPGADPIHPVTLGDWTYSISSVWYHCHREIDGCLKCGSDVTIHQPDGHPLVYVAMRGHGVYPQSGVWPRIFGAANDQCGEGTLWVPDTVQLLPEAEDVAAMERTGTQWVRYPGRWGVPWPHGGTPEERAKPDKVKDPGGPPPGPAAQGWWRHEPCVSRTHVKRLVHFMS